MYEFTKIPTGWRLHWGPPPRCHAEKTLERQHSALPGLLVVEECGWTEDEDLMESDCPVLLAQ
jgi:hypothetical protein